MSELRTKPTFELAHTAMSEAEALRFLEGHRISLGGRTMDPKAQIVGEFVKSIRVPGYFPRRPSCVWPSAITGVSNSVRAPHPSTLCAERNPFIASDRLHWRRGIPVLGKQLPLWESQIAGFARLSSKNAEYCLHWRAS